MADHVVENSGLTLTDGTYDVIRFFVEKILPAVGVFYAVLAGAWGWDNVVPVTASIGGLTVFLGVVLSFARSGYKVTPLPTSYDGQVVQGVTEEGETYLRLQLDPKATTDILNKPVINIKGFDASA